MDEYSEDLTRTLSQSDQDYNQSAPDSYINGGYVPNDPNDYTEHVHYEYQ